MPSLIPSLVAISLLAASVNSYADDLLVILKRMSEADHNQNYRGTFILRKSDKLSTLQVTHGAGENGDWENIRSLSGESKNVFRRNKQVVSVYPEREIVTVRYTDKKHSLHPKLPDNLEQLGLFYSMKRLDDDRVANHQTVVVDLVPNDQYRYGYRYWVDKNTGMLLRCDLFDEDKTVIEQMMFTSLDYLPKPPAETFDLQKFDQFQQKNIRGLEAVTQSNEKQQWTVNRLPKGFMLTQNILRNTSPIQTPTQALTQSPSQTPTQTPNQTQLKSPKMVTGSTSVAVDTALANTGEIVIHSNEPPAEPMAQKPELLHMVYSDGLASVSVFIEKDRGGSNHLQGAASMGAVNAYGNPVEDYFVTVVGEVPANTVRAMAQSTVRLH